MMTSAEIGLLAINGYGMLVNYILKSAIFEKRLSNNRHFLKKDSLKIGIFLE